MKQLPYFFCLLFLGAACGKEKDSPKPAPVETTETRILGIWNLKFQSVTTYDASNNVIFAIQEHSHAGGTAIKFGPQGLLEEGSSFGGVFNPGAKGNYSINGNNLTLNITDSRKLYSGAFHIDTLNTTKLTLIDTINFSSWPQGKYDVIKFRAFR